MKRNRKRSKRMSVMASRSMHIGGVLVMLPILQNYLGLTPDMLALVTAIYILFDPIITACNVAGNGAFAIFFDRIGRR